MLKRLEAVVSGQVQGIGYRFFARHHAEKLGLKGYAKNAPDETVEIIAEGEEAQLKKFLQLLEKGPPFSRVDNVHADWAEARKDFSGFEVR